jgi:hypothetical protein
MGIEWQNSPVSEVTMRRSGRNLRQRSGQDETLWSFHFLNSEKSISILMKAHIDDACLKGMQVVRIEVFVKRYGR